MHFIKVFFLIVLCSLILGCFGSNRPTPVGEQGETIHLLGAVGVHEALVALWEQRLAPYHIRVEKNFFYWDTYWAKARMAIINNTGEYDIILGTCAKLNHFVNSGKVIPLNDVAERAGLKMAALYRPLQESLPIRGKMYCLPYLVDTPIFIYRRDLYQKAGLIPPRTLKQLYLNGKKMTAEGRFGLAFPANPQENAAILWSYFLWSSGGEFFDRRWHPALSSRMAQNATQLYNQMLQECAPPAVATWQTEEAVNFFVSGRLAAMILWSGASAILGNNEKSRVAGKVGYAPLPAGDLGKAIPPMEAWGAIVPSRSKHILAAKKFCEVMVGRETLEAVASLGIAPTPVPEINQRYAEAAPHSSFAIATRLLTVAREQSALPESTQLNAIIGSALNGILTGADVKATLETLDRQVDSIMRVSKYYPKEP
ncbi:carbohydrate ABC transporter substrate-binding protein (CUT1 family) [Hydrogenispora ethanolica]|jgi:ABC-type glycerol-3-phosphate transport system substrate-binding protein|uniref:Carbohydrate ABC transporter substrate-binding protein (CUT1 family) n=1 Tax=Hydrogenispora ethanolica TaxID=1082276 RepID=A0A4R1RW17_HYDET|nr:extracellular solute-binding protein [Hydrogenispora ethanolica]TCL70865.1 carbohydrate ABC transporter substrate-binding protein (CUT1 family) [Hydrogenispora ethanolica]